MISLHEYKTWPACSLDGHYDNLIVFSRPNLVSPKFPIAAKMSQILFEGNAHIVHMPSWSSYIGASKFLVAFTTMAITATAAAIWGNFTAFGLTLFSCVATLFIGGYYRLALGYKPILYNCWAILTLETFGVVFWLASFILLAQWTIIYNHSIYWGDTYLAYLPYNATHDTKRTPLMRTSSGQYHAGVILAGIATGFGGLEFALFTTSLVVFSINLHKHYREGYPAVYGRARSEPLVTSTPVLGKTEKPSTVDEVK